MPGFPQRMPGFSWADNMGAVVAQVKKAHSDYSVDVLVTGDVPRLLERVPISTSVSDVMMITNNRRIQAGDFVQVAVVNQGTLPIVTDVVDRNAIRQFFIDPDAAPGTPLVIPDDPATSFLWGSGAGEGELGGQKTYTAADRAKLQQVKDAIATAAPVVIKPAINLEEEGMASLYGEERWLKRRIFDLQLTAQSLESEGKTSDAQQIRDLMRRLAKKVKDPSYDVSVFEGMGQMEV